MLPGNYYEKSQQKYKEWELFQTEQCCWKSWKTGEILQTKKTSSVFLFFYLFDTTYHDLMRNVYLTTLSQTLS